MKIIVVGCGKVGAALTAQLSQEGHDIAVIDVDSRVVALVTPYRWRPGSKKPTF